MFMETITAPIVEWNLVNEKSRLTDDPPAGLIAHVAWESGPDEVTAVMVWETASQRGDFAVEVMMPLFQSGELADVSSNPSPVQPLLAQFPGHAG